MTLAGAMRILDTVQGEPIRWFRAMGRCPCTNPASGVHDRSHALCGGTGVLTEEVDVSQYRAIISDVRTARIYSNIGPLVQGDLIASTWTAEIPLAQDDTVIVLSRTRAETVILTRGSTADDAIGTAHVTQIDRVFDLNGVISSALYRRDGDSIAWQTGQGPVAGSRYSVRFRYQPLWQVIANDTLARRRDLDGRALPQAVGLKLITPAR